MTASRKLPEGARRPLNADSNFWFGCVYPDGPEGYYNGELIPDCSHRLSTEERLKILETHPLFTGCCPVCSWKFPVQSPPRMHWNCEQCGWQDNSV